MCKFIVEERPFSSKVSYTHLDSILSDNSDIFKHKFHVWNLSVYTKGNIRKFGSLGSFGLEGFSSMVCGNIANMTRKPTF